MDFITYVLKMDIIIYAFYGLIFYFIGSLAINAYWEPKIFKATIEADERLNKAGIEHEKINSSQIEINGQIWMTKNLNVNQYQNGDTVILCQSENEWKNAIEKKTPASCYYNFDENIGEIYGRLYNWYAVNDPRGLSPKGWKMPSTDIIYSLIEEIKNENSSDLRSRLGWKLKQRGRNALGFSAIPSGIKCEEHDDIFLFQDNDDVFLFQKFLDKKTILKSNFIGLGELSGFWSTTEVPNKGLATSLIISEDTFLLNVNKSIGLSVRCVKEYAFANTQKTTEKSNNISNPDEYKEKYIKLLEAEVERLKNEKK